MLAFCAVCRLLTGLPSPISGVDVAVNAFSIPVVPSNKTTQSLPVALRLTRRAVMPISAALTALTIPAGVSVVTLTEDTAGDVFPIVKSIEKALYEFSTCVLLVNPLLALIVPCASWSTTIS